MSARMSTHMSRHKITQMFCVDILEMVLPHRQRPKSATVMSITKWLHSALQNIRPSYAAKNPDGAAIGQP